MTAICYCAQPRVTKDEKGQLYCTRCQMWYVPKYGSKPVATVELTAAHLCPLCKGKGHTGQIVSIRGQWRHRPCVCQDKSKL